MPTWISREDQEHERRQEEERERYRRECACPDSPSGEHVFVEQSRYTNYRSEQQTEYYYTEEYEKSYEETSSGWEPYEKWTYNHGCFSPPPKVEVQHEREVTVSVPYEVAYYRCRYCSASSEREV